YTNNATSTPYTLPLHVALPIYAADVLGRDEAPGDTRLVGHHPDEQPARAQPAQRLRGAGHRADLGRVPVVGDVLDDRAVAVEQGGAHRRWPRGHVAEADRPVQPVPHRGPRDGHARPRHAAPLRGPALLARAGAGRDATRGEVGGEPRPRRGGHGGPAATTAHRQGRGRAPGGHGGDEPPDAAPPGPAAPPPGA